MDELDRKHEEYMKNMPKPEIKKDLSWLKKNKNELLGSMLEKNDNNSDIKCN